MREISSDRSAELPLGQFGTPRSLSLPLACSLPLTHSIRRRDRVVIIQRDRAHAGGLSDEVAKYNLGSETADVPYRMKLHPSGRALVVTNALGGFKVVRIERSDAEALPALKAPAPSVAKAAEKCSFVGTIKSVSFSSDGRTMALGADDGKVHVMGWPGLEKRGVIDVTKNTTKGLRNVDFSVAHDDRLLFACDEWGSCFVYDVETLKVVGELGKPDGMGRMAIFRVVSRMEGRERVLYGVGNCNKMGYVLRWNEVEKEAEKDRTDRTDRTFALDKASKANAKAPFCACALSHDGTMLAAVTPDAEQVVVSTETLRLLKYVKGAHLTFATAVGFTEDDDAIVSVSADGSAVLTELGVDGSGTVLKLLIAALLMAAIALMVHLYGREAVRQEPERVVDIVGRLTDAFRSLVSDGRNK